jgi:hypothetical protein
MILVLSKTEGSGIVRGGLHPWPSSAAFGILKAGSGLKLLLQKAFCRSGFSRDPCATDDGRRGIGGSGFIRGLGDLEGRRFGAKAPPTKSDPRVIENQGFEVKASPAKDR